ncbi:MAG: inositol monophosphatase family protein, partial [Candidatus Hodarchaeales archaeon]
KAIALNAGKVLLDRFKSANRINIKSDMSLVTEADLKANAIILESLEKKFPNHSILSEETGLKDQDSDYLWIIDPLDGTTNFSNHIPFFAVSIGLLYKNTPLIGVVYSPFQDELFYAEYKKGAYLNGHSIKVDNKKNLDTAFLAFDNGRNPEIRMKMIRIYQKLKLRNNVMRQVGAAALELCYVAAGRFGGFIMPGVNSWDVIAGSFIVNEGFGITTDFKNVPFSMKSHDLLASSPLLHEHLLEVITIALSA